MSSTQINTIQTTTSVKTNFETEKLTPIALPQKSDDDASKKDKKSKGCLFNKVQTTSPKLQSSYDVNQKTAQELIALYGGLPPSERNTLIKEIFESNPNRLNDIYQNLPSNSQNQFVADELKALSPIFVEMFNEASPDIKAQGSKEFLSQIASLLNTLPKDEKDEFLSKFKKSLNSILKNKKNLSSSDKKDIKDFIKQINSYQKGNIGTSDLLDVKSKEILNIMMIMVKAFCNSMNTESLDMLSQIDQISTNNMFLNIAQTKLEEDGTKLAKLGNVAAKGWIFVLVSIAIFAIVLLASMFGAPEAEADVSLNPALKETGAQTQSLEEEEITEEEEVTKNNTVETNLETNNPLKSDASTSAPNTTADNLQAPEDVSKNTDEGTSSDNSSDKSSDEVEKQRIKDQQVAKDNDVQANKETFLKKQGSNLEENVKNAWDDLKRFRKARQEIATFQPKKLGLSAVKKAVMMGGFGTMSLYGFLKGIAPKYVNFIKNTPQQPNALDLALTQNDSSVETTITDTLNNSIQTSSKFIDNDSQKQNQYSGDVQQAINMLGQAYTGQ